MKTWEQHQLHFEDSSEFVTHIRRFFTSFLGFIRYCWRGDDDNEWKRWNVSMQQQRAFAKCWPLYGIVRTFFQDIDNSEFKGLIFSPNLVIRIEYRSVLSIESDEVKSKNHFLNWATRRWVWAIFTACRPKFITSIVRRYVVCFSLENYRLPTGWYLVFSVLFSYFFFLSNIDRLKISHWGNRVSPTSGFRYININLVLFK